MNPQFLEEIVFGEVRSRKDRLASVLLTLVTSMSSSSDPSSPSEDNKKRINSRGKDSAISSIYAPVLRSSAGTEGFVGHDKDYARTTNL